MNFIIFTENLKWFESPKRKILSHDLITKVGVHCNSSIYVIFLCKFRYGLLRHFSCLDLKIGRDLDGKRTKFIFIIFVLLFGDRWICEREVSGLSGPKKTFWSRFGIRQFYCLLFATTSELWPLEYTIQLNSFYFYLCSQATPVRITHLRLVFFIKFQFHIVLQLNIYTFGIDIHMQKPIHINFIVFNSMK